MKRQKKGFVILPILLLILLCAYVIRTLGIANYYFERTNHLLIIQEQRHKLTELCMRWAMAHLRSLKHTEYQLFFEKKLETADHARIKIVHSDNIVINVQLVKNQMIVAKLQSAVQIKGDNLEILRWIIPE